MKRVLLFASIMFWFGIAAIWIAAWNAAAADDDAYSAAEVAEHATAASCWLIIDGRVYDVTAYIDVHPADPDTILRYCGRDGTVGFETKDRGRPHSSRAWRALQQYEIGALVP